jgi:DNA-binding winged helix-turn-helix (wHTH) protein
MRIKLLIVSLLTLAVLLLSAATFSRTTNQSEYLERRAILVVRDIGHKLLLQAGDVSSRVLPVKQLSNAIFQLEFQNKFAFTPDSMVRVVQGEITSDLPLNYLVSVFDCSSKEMVYGFEIRPENNNITPCLGRLQPSGCYYIQIAFPDLLNKSGSLPKFSLAMITILCIALVAAIISTFRKREKQPGTMREACSIALGKYLFEGNRKILTHNSKIIELSEKETQLLSIFAANQNQLIDRDRLLKEVWENEGVFTGRSLDVFISKLRKKLSHDPSIRIANIHGRGYKLETDRRSALIKDH